MIKVIKTDADYETALAAIETLIDIDPDEGTPEADQLDVMTVLIQDYESKNYQFDLPDPIYAIKFCMEQQNLTRRKLEAYIGNRSKVSEVLSRKRPLTLSMIRALHSGLGIPAEVLLQERDPSLLEETDIDWSRFPLREMIKRNWIKGSLADLPDRAEDLLRPFFASLGPPQTINAFLRKSKHVRSARTMDDNALKAWTVRIIHLAEEYPPTVVCRPNTVDLEFMQQLAQLSPSDDGPLRARDFLRDHGISLIIEQHLSQTYLDGAAILSQSNRPIIGLTLRYDRIDNFWFSLMHELAHIALHIDREITRFYDDLDINDQGDLREKEADHLASNALIPAEAWENSLAPVSKSPASAEILAEELGIHRAIVAGRIRKEFNRYRHRGLSQMVGHNQVRKWFNGTE